MIWICIKFIYGMYLSLCIVLIWNNMHSTYSSFAGKHWIILQIIFLCCCCLYIKILADSNLYRCLREIKCSKSRMETLLIFVFRSEFYTLLVVEKKIRLVVGLRSIVRMWDLSLWRECTPWVGVFLRKYFRIHLLVIIFKG